MSADKSSTVAKPPRRRFLQFSLRTALIAMALFAVLLAAWPLIDRVTTTISQDDWTYSETVSRFNPYGSFEGRLLYKGHPVPASLVDHDITLMTPVGNFVTNDTRPWVWFGNYGMPPPLHINPSPDIEMPLLIEQGYYDTSELDLSMSGNEAWVGAQLTGTPSHWVYVYKDTSTGHIGYWVDPEKLDELSWKK